MTDVPSAPDATAELLALSQQLLDSIDRQDWETYTRLCNPSLTAYEPEAVGHLVEGMPFHRFYFEMQSSGRAKQSTISSPRVRLMPGAAVVTYTRLVQRVEADGRPSTAAFEETRVWERQDGVWKHVHFHRSPAGNVLL